MMDTMQEINFAFSYSAKHTHQCRSTRTLEATPHELEKRSKLRELCETRWSASGDALFTFLNSFDVIVDSLSNLIDEGYTKAQSHLNNILSFYFIICLVTAEHLIQSTTQLSKLLQMKSFDLLEAVKEATGVIGLLQS